MTSDQRHHLNLLALFYFLFHNLFDWLVYIILTVGPLNSFLKRHGINPLVGFGGLIALIVLIIAVRYWCFTFQIGPDMLTINSGIFVKKHTHIPYGRIQTIQRSQWFFLKPFHLEKLQIETAGHDDHSPEAVLPLVNESVRAQIDRNRLTQAAGQQPIGDSNPAETDRLATPSYLINPHDLNVFALTSLGIFPLIGALFALYAKIQDMIPQRIIDSITSKIIHQSLIIIVAVGLLIVIVSIITSYLTIIQKYYKFTLTTQAGQLKTYQGLFQRSSVTIPTNRIQAIRLKQNVIRQLCRLSTIQALAASSAGDDEKSNDLMIIPVVDTSKAFATLAAFINWTPHQKVALDHLAKKSYWYFIRNAMLMTTPLIVICVYFFKFLGGLSLFLLIPAILLGWYAAGNTGWAINNNQLIMQNGHWLTRSQYIIPKKNVQSFGLRQSIWMHRNQLAHVQVSVRHGNHNQLIELRYLPIAKAETLFNWLKNR
ncbi:membrane protein [Lentilactobacillus fungorum]|uniref:Membrane protein n=1 Tax=Lentilactobacillus fungorum TaxID=2201250 RepID=A0ABQ3W2R6_9LACO|nr:PH domain-containing protein [Lentilactobacillus fungorum]GHP14903.1 membrane protein [Lentilactobacillus fungorum]